MGRSDTVIRRCWQEWMDNGRFQRHHGSGRPRTITYREYTLIVRSDVISSDSSLSTNRHATRKEGSSMTIHKCLIERNLSSYQPFSHLPLTPAHCRAGLEGCLVRSVWNHADWGRIVFSDESHFQLQPDDNRRRPGQHGDTAFSIARYTGPQPIVMVWCAISFDSPTRLVVIRDTLTAQRYIDDILRIVLLPFLLIQWPYFSER
ncbi:HTH_Tnp_Tc3_2 domain-containing protein [Trichonephila clavipes]|nr:HTH_Tnp_Tc3_2 domain-containing protein [Trichonephila clavipes]